MTRSFSALIAVLILLAVPATAQPAFQVKDLCTTTSVGQSPLPPFGGGVEAGGLAFFTVDDGVHGSEMWRSDGTDAGTFLLRDICPGSCWPWLGESAALGGELYFLAGAKGQSYFPQLWKTDGTVAGTEEVLPLRVRDIISLSDNRLLLDAYPAQGSGESLWISDGTAAGTSAFAAVSSGSFLGRAGDIVFFAGWDSEHGNELWRTDGTAAGTFLVKDINEGPDTGVFGFARYPVVNGRLFFTAWPRGASYTELWVTDGTPAGTYSINRLLPGTSWGDPRNLVARGKDVFFLTSTGFVAWELWKTDGTAAGTVRLHSNVSTFPYVPSLAVVGAEIFFPAFADGWGQELWKSDGTVAGTVPVADIAPGIASGLHPGDAPLFAAVGSKLVIYADDGTHGYEPWASDGTAAGTFLLADINPGSDTSAPDLGYFGQGTVAGDNGFFGAFTAPQDWALWASDGTVDGTRAVHRFRTQTSSWPLFLDLGGQTLIAADPGAGEGRRLWRTDGSAQDTREIRPARPNDRPVGITSLARFGDRALLSGDYLWITDGTEAGTRRLNASPFIPGSLVPSGGQVFFIDQKGFLWRTDGTNRGTHRTDFDVTPIFSLTAVQGGVAFMTEDGAWERIWVSDGTLAGTRSITSQLSVLWLARQGDRFFFLAWDPGSGETALWRSDGTQKGTRIVSTLSVFPLSGVDGDSAQPVIWRGRLYFVADDGVHGRELWTSDGTRKGTHPVADIFPGSGSPDIQELTAAPDRLYFVADDGVHGRELWQSDGTAAGTRMVRDIAPGPGSSYPQNLTAVHHTLLFAADDGKHGLEPWVSDGTKAGTRMLQDIAPGPDPSSPSGFTVSGPYIYFSANDGVTGFEPWAVRLP